MPRRLNAMDPLAEQMLAAGGTHALETVTIAGHRRQVFKGAPRTLAGLYDQAMQHGERVMVVQDGVSLSYAQGFAQAAALADALRNQFGVRAGTKVAVVMSNRIEWIISVLAITAVGGVAALVNSRGVAEEMLRAIETAQCALAIMDLERADIIAAAVTVPAWPCIIVGASPLAPPLQGRGWGGGGQQVASSPDFAQTYTPHPNPSPEGEGLSLPASFEALSTPQPGLAFKADEMHPEDGGIVLFTSGTTGFPKAALLSQGAIAHSVSIAAFMGLVQDTRYEEENGVTLPPERRSMTTPAVILGPMFHLSGIMPIFRAISLGTTIHIMTKWSADIAFDMIESIGMSRLSFVPAMLWDMLRSPRATPETLGKVAYMANGAAALNPTLLAEIRERMPNCLLSNTYGQTETTAWTCSISGAAYLANPGSCGWPAPSVEVSICRDDGSEADIGEAGELWVSSAGLMTEYLGDAKATAETLIGGWLASGDVAIADEQGLITIIDRKKNMVISGGENIYCAEVERVLADHPTVRDCIAYGVPDERLGERLVAHVVVADDSTVSEDDIKTYCRAYLAIYKIPRIVIISQNPLPRTASGKVDRGTFLRNLIDLT